MDEIVEGGEQEQIPSKIRLISKRSSDYKLEFINGAICNLTARGEIVCDFHLETRDRPTEQIAKIAEDGTAIGGEFIESGIYTRDVKFGIVINAPFAKSLVELLNKKIEESEEVIRERAKRSMQK